MQNKLDYWINHWINHWLLNKLNKQNGLFYYPTSKKRCMPTKFPKLFIDGITLERENQIIYSLSSTTRPLFKEIDALNIYEINIFNILYLMFKCINKACPKAFENLFSLKPKNKYQLKRSCTLLEPFCKSKFSQLCINYRCPHLWNTIVLSQNTDLEQSITLKLFKERLNTYLFTLDNVTFWFWFCIL